MSTSRSNQSQSAWRRWVRRYLPLEIAGLATAFAAGAPTWTLTHDVIQTFLITSIGEAIGFYVAAIGREVWHNWRSRSTDGTWTVIVRTARNLVLEYGAAEVLDTLLLRPGAMWAAHLMFTNIVASTALGMLAADLCFYLAAIPGFEIRRHLDGKNERPVVDLPGRRRMATPVLIMDLDLISATYRRIMKAVPFAHLYYVASCNPAHAVLEHVRSLGCRFQISSVEELDAIVAIGASPTKVIYTAPVKPADDIAAAYAAGVRRFAVDSPDEVRKLAALAPGSSVMILLRPPGLVNDDGSFTGVDPAHTIALARMSRHLGLVPYALQLAMGSHAYGPRGWEAAIACAGDVMRATQADGIRFRALDLGHWQSRALRGANAPSVEAFGGVIAGCLRRHVPYRVNIILEPGAELVGEAGTLATTVVGTAERTTGHWLHLDIDTSDDFSDALDVTRRAHAPISDSRHSAFQEAWTIAGTRPHQGPALHANLSTDLRAGDHVIFHGAGAYMTRHTGDVDAVVVATDNAHPLRPQPNAIPTQQRVTQ